MCYYVMLEMLLERKYLGKKWLCDSRKDLHFFESLMPINKNL